MIQNFGQLSVSPPIDATEVEKTAEKLKSVRDALKIKGKLEQAEGKARFLKDKSHIESERYIEMKASFEKLDFETRKAVEAVFRSVKFGKADLSFAGKDGDDEDEEVSSRPVGKFTDLKPT